MTKPSVGLVGCGWLGKALTIKLVANNYDVVVTTQTESNIEKLKVLGAKVECFSASVLTNSAAEYKLFQQHLLIVAIPPMIRQGRQDYPEKIKRIVQLAEAGEVKQLILISSTAVYNGLVGSIDETAIIDSSQKKSHIIDQAEKIALLFKGHTVILRLAGLVGPERHPGKFLKAGRALADPQATTNLIHQTDAVGLLFGLINYTPHTAIYNGCSDTHITKKEYYEKAARTLGLSAPVFAENKVEDISEGNSQSKTINGSKLPTLLGYHFIYNDLLKWLDE